MIKPKVEKKPRYNSIQNTCFTLHGIWEYDRSLFLLLALEVIFGGIQPLPLLFLPKLVLDEVAVSGDFIKVVQIVVAIISIWFVCAIVKVQMDRIYNRFISVRIGFLIRYGRKAMTMDFEHLENPDVLNLASRANRCIIGNNNNGLQGIMLSIQDIGNAAITLVGCAYIVFILHPALILIFSILLATNYFFRFKCGHIIKKLCDEQEGISRRLSYILNTMKNFAFGKDIRIFNMKKWIESRHAEAMDEYYKGNKKIHNKTFYYEQIYIVTSLIQEVSLYAFLVWKAFEGMSIGDFILYAGVIRTFVGTLDGIFGRIAHISKQSLEVCDYREFLDYPDNVICKNPCKLNLIDFNKYEFVFENVSFKYPNKEEYALKNINIKIRAGERLAVVGLNGAGKSTFIKLLCRLYEPTEGKIKLNGVDIKKYSKSDYYKIFGVVFQDIHMFSFTIAENVSMNERDRTNDNIVNKSLELAGLYEKVATLKARIETNMLKVIEDDGLELSGGETQKLALARALYKNAPVIILDEPTSSLDALAEYNLYKKFDDLFAGKTSIYISHRLASTRFCDVIILFEHGEITDCGTHDELLVKGGTYTKMFNMQAQYYKEGKAFGNGELERLLVRSDENE
jgi:ABC-type multidrug transport system fused ATPase/permease subunit